MPSVWVFRFDFPVFQFFGVAIFLFCFDFIFWDKFHYVVHVGFELGVLLPHSPNAGIALCHNSLPWNKILKCWKCIILFIYLLWGTHIQHVCGGQSTPVGAGSLLVSGSWGTHSSCQYWWQLPLPHWAISLGLFIVVMWHTYMMCVSVGAFWSQLFLTTMDSRD